MNPIIHRELLVASWRGTGRGASQTVVPTQRVGTRAYSLIAWLSAGLLVCLSPSLGIAGPADFDEVIDSPMYRNPVVPLVPEVVKLPEEAQALWARALDGQDEELKCWAAQTIVQAHHRGFKGLETTIPSLLAACEKADQPLAVRLAVARALVELDAREAAASFFRQAQSGDGDLRETIEPALARWDYRPARQMWLERLRQPTNSHRDLILAMHGLASVGEKGATDRLHEIALDKQVSGPIRVEAAHALGKLRTEGLHKDAERLAADASPQAIASRLTAAWLLRHHGGEESIRVLQKLARDAEPTVAAVAIARLLEIDPELLVPDLEKFLANRDAPIRSLAVNVLHRRPTEKHLHLLSERLDDVHIDVRRKARRFLLELAREEKWSKQIIADATIMLNKEGWRGQEQATILLTQLDQKQVAGRLVELLSSNRLEVKVTAAWGLRKLNVPQTLPDVVHYIEEDIKTRPVVQARAGVLPGRPPVLVPPIEDQFKRDVRDHTLSQLHQFLGQRKYRPAERVLGQFIPKFAFGFAGESRAAAIWALGMIHEGKADDDLVVALEGRLNDQMLPAEDFRVRWMCGVALGRMKAKSSLETLRKGCPFFKVSRSFSSNACGWAIEQITGEKMPPPDTLFRYRTDWFLLPDQWGSPSKPTDGAK
jgi:HEAT repeat protein